MNKEFDLEKGRRLRNCAAMQLYFLPFVLPGILEVIP